MSGSSGSGAEATQHFLEMILGVRGQCVTTRVHTNRGAAWYVVVKFHVRLLGLIELHVPVAVWWYFACHLLTQLDLGESGAVWWEAAHLEGWREFLFLLENFSLFFGGNFS